MRFLYPLVTLTLLLAACAEPAPTRPKPPTAVSAASGLTTTGLRWEDNSNNEAGFVIYRDTLSAPNVVAAALEPLAEVTPNTTHFVDDTATSEARYIYHVAAKNALGESESVRQTGEAVRVRPAFETVVGSATMSDWRFPGVLTAFLFLVNEDSAKPQSNIAVSVNGPEGWNDNRPYTFTVYASEFGRDVVRIAPNAPLVSGHYSVSAVVNGQSYVTESEVSTELKLEVSPITFDFQPTQRSADVTWTPVSGAVSYRAYVGASDINVAVGETHEQRATFNNLDLQPAEYTGRVYAFNYDVTGAQPESPFGQFMVSLAESSSAELVPFTNSTFAKVDPSARYLVGDDNDTGKPATALSLSRLGAGVGECVGLMREGDFKGDSTRPDLSGDMIAVFSGGAGFLMPGALGDQKAEYTSPTASGKANDIPEDFWIPARRIVVQIPEGATQLLVAADDVRNSDDSDPDSDFGVLYAKVECPSAAQLRSYEMNSLIQ